MSRRHSKIEPELIKEVLAQVTSLYPETIRQGRIQESLDAYENHLAFVLQHLHGPARILDVGAGGGVLAVALRRLGHSVTAIDNWKEYDGVASPMGHRKDILQILSDNQVQLKIADIMAQAMPLEDESFDLVLLMDVIEHLKEPGMVLRDIHRLLKPEGVFIMVTPNLSRIGHRLRFLYGKSPNWEVLDWCYAPNFFGHVREYTKEELIAMANHVGFITISICFRNQKNLESCQHPFRMKIYRFASWLYPNFSPVIYSSFKKAGH
jgi:2-polyprenyl-3-methyl-5-hydroxy-6-metoxy-1,4-benzoquinol methylase